jgi:hypothetical protein
VVLAGVAGYLAGCVEWRPFYTRVLGACAWTGLARLCPIAQYAAVAAWATYPDGIDIEPS